MFKTLPLWANIMIGYGISLVLVVAGMLSSGLSNMRETIEIAERAELKQQAETMLSAVARETRMAEAMSALLANMPEVQQRFAEDDRDWLREQLVPAYKVLEKDYGARQFQFHRPPATSWLRLHKPEKFGDDLSSFRHSVVNTNAKQTPTRGLETGVAGLGARGIVPVFHLGRHLGSLEFGMSFGQAFFDEIKAKRGLDAGLHIQRKDGFQTFAATFPEKAPLLKTGLFDRVMQGEDHYSTSQLGNTPVAIYATRVLDYSGAPLGVLEVAMDRSHYLALLKRSSANAWTIGFLALLLGLAGALLTAQRLNKRIRTVVDGVNQVAAGDLTRPILDDGSDEIGVLAKAAEGMRRQLHDLVASMEQNAAQVLQAAQEITASVDNQAATSSEMSSSVSEITSTMEELSASSSQIAENSESVVNIANRTFENAQSGADAMQVMVDYMRDIRQDNQDSIQEILNLGQKSKEISKVMEIINTVADQTKLIAFNAALEASSAGEAGRRFGVVAAEIRRLADNVTQSTGEIETKVNEIQDSISRLVVTSEKGAKGIEEGMQASGRTAERLNGLVEDASQSADSAQQISLSTQQQKTASKQVVTALREIVSASSNTAEAIRRISTISREMATLSSSLKQEVEVFTLNSEAGEATPAANAGH
ncbi:methyl-accepting chemotaxis protein [Magnetovirga frankeli]|uniref:methyl-accepting chemotaxis protein n=1 Tax=Magnetovirga frankeli TaxID=947516 RepID=UPI0012937E4F|nr:methyl-accepting chemotaxis protein [gamma proteobacterium SS-5]